MSKVIRIVKMTEAQVSLQLTYNIEKGVITFNGYDALGRESATKLPLSVIAQMENLFAHATIRSMIKDKQHKKIVKVSPHLDCTNAFLKKCGSDIEVKEIEQRKREPISKEDRIKVWTKYHNESSTGDCYCCGKNVSILKWDASHVVADSTGGNVVIDNLRVCCVKCNRSMGNKNLYIYIIENDKQGPGRKNAKKYIAEMQAGKMSIDTCNIT